MATSVATSFPDSTYTASNKPSVATLKADVQSIETAVNTHNAATTGEHGVAGTFVGTSDAQTLTNKTLTSPVLNTGVSGTAFLDEDNMASDSATKIASQQSIKAYVDTTIASSVAAAKAALFPVGSIYTAIVSTNPGTLLGFGTWTAFGTGRMLVGIDSGDTKFDTVEETGGAETVTLTTTEMPAHTHNVIGSSAGGTGGTRIDAQTSGLTDETSSAGSGAAFSIMNPYIVVHFWKRTA